MISVDTDRNHGFLKITGLLLLAENHYLLSRVNMQLETLLLIKNGRDELL